MSLQKNIGQTERNDIFQTVTAEKCVNFGLNCRTREDSAYQRGMDQQHLPGHEPAGADEALFWAQERQHSRTNTLETAWSAEYPAAVGEDLRQKPLEISGRSAGPSSGCSFLRRL